MRRIDFEREEGDISLRKYKSGEFELKSPALGQPLRYTLTPWNCYRLVERGGLCDIHVDLYRGCYAVFITDILIKSNFHYIEDVRTYIREYRHPEPLSGRCSMASFKCDMKLPGFTLTDTVNGKRRTRTVCHVRTNAIALREPAKPGSESWLFLPPASLLEYNRKILRIYEPACRFYNKKEMEASMLWESRRDPAAYESGANAEFCREKAFWIKQGMEYMFGVEQKTGMQKNSNLRLITDTHIKGNLSLEYEVHLPELPD